METDERARWKAWKLKTFDTDYMIWHDGLNTGAVSDLTGREREEALAMLRLGVSLGDSHASEALAAMKDTGSLDSMKAELLKASGAEDETAPLESVEKDPDYLVRNHAGSSLLTRWKIDPSEISRHDAIFSLIVAAEDKDLTAGDFARFKKARALLEALKKNQP